MRLGLAGFCVMALGVLFVPYLTLAQQTPSPAAESSGDLPKPATAESKASEPDATKKDATAPPESAFGDTSTVTAPAGSNEPKATTDADERLSAGAEKEDATDESRPKSQKPAKKNAKVGKKKGGVAKPIKRRAPPRGSH